MMIQDSKTPFCSSKFSWAPEIIYPKIIDNLDTGAEKGSQSRTQRLIIKL